LSTNGSVPDRHWPDADLAVQAGRHQCLARRAGILFLGHEQMAQQVRTLLPHRLQQRRVRPMHMHGHAPGKTALGQNRLRAIRRAESARQGEQAHQRSQNGCDRLSRYPSVHVAFPFKSTRSQKR
jgi:hypothetical protein